MPLMEHQGTCERRLEAAFVSLAPKDLVGLGDSLRQDEAGRRRFEQLAEVDLALARSMDEFAVLGPFEARIASSFESLDSFFSPAVEAVETPPVRPVTRIPRWALAAAAVLVAILLPLGMERDRSGPEQTGVWTERGDSATYLRPYCMDPVSHRMDVAIEESGIASCSADQYLVLTYALRTDAEAWLHAVALPFDDDEAVWIVPNPRREAPVWTEAAERPTEAWPPIDLSINYPPGAYQIVWAACDQPIQWADWALAANNGQEALVELLDMREDCEEGTWLFVVRETTP